MADAGTLAAHPTLLGSIREALADDAEVVLYGCSMSAGAEGAAFVDRLSGLLGCRVSASDRPVGARALGADWSIATRGGLAFDEVARAAHPHRLPTFDFESVTLSGTGSLQQAVSGVTVTATRSDGATWTFSASLATGSYAITAIGNDTVGSASGDDRLFGGQGDDSLHGNLGDDTIITGSGADTVVVGSSGGADVVTDFDGTSGDRIQIAADVNGSGIDTFAEVKAAATDTADGVQIALGSDNTLTLSGITVDQLQSDRFAFG